MSRASDLTQVDELLNRLVRAVRRPAYRSLILDGVGDIPGAEALRVLRSVELRERRGERTSISEVAADLEVEQSTSSRAVNAVVERGLVSRAADPADARRTLLSLTDHGRTALERATTNRRRLIEDVTRDWSADEVAAFMASLDVLVTRYEQVEAR